MKLVLAIVLGLAVLPAWAEEATCKVKGMHCEGCTENVVGKLCDKTKYSTCEVKILDEKKEIGQVKLNTMDATAKVDQKAVGALIEDAGYKLDKCTTKPSAKAKTEDKKSS